MIIDILFEKIDENNYFISSHSGANTFLKKNEFISVVENRMPSYLFRKLYTLGMIVGKENEKRYISNYLKLNRYLFSPPTLHIVVLTTKCNHACVYCRAKPEGTKIIDMNFKTAQKTIDFIFSVPSDHITVEFQGGESFINWKVFEESVLYINEKNRKKAKDVLITIVTNLSLMNSKKLEFIMKNNISLCTSLDGPCEIHNTNRIYFAQDSYKNTILWLSKIIKLTSTIKKGQPDSLPSALMTTTRISLKRWKEIIDEYRNLSLGGIFIRPLSPIGYASSRWNEIGYTPDEFLEFYEKSLDYIIEINREEKFIERNAAIKLKKILFNEDPNYLDLRSPCGSVIGQMAYYPDGGIYTCDEGRMIENKGENIFKIGDVFSSSYKSIIKSLKSKAVIYSSNIDIYPQCSRCAFKPYCGVCPAFNYSTKGSLINIDFSNYWCVIEKGIFKILIKKLMKREIKDIFMRWFDA
ncbi:MAG: His-Xaa-Ser system radical SAM maturase HxsB [Elusimicrobiales bacterium]